LECNSKWKDGLPIRVIHVFIVVGVVGRISVLEGSYVSQFERPVESGIEQLTRMAANLSLAMLEEKWV
jgi:hypothetical protein